MTIKQSPNTANIAVVAVLILAVAVSAFMGWRAYGKVGTGSGAAVSSGDTLTVPELKLNATRERQGGTVEPSGAGGGRANPFLAP